MLSSFFSIPAASCQTGDKISVTLGGFFDQELSAALGTFFWDRFVPDCKFTVRKAVAAVKNFSAL